MTAAILSPELPAPPGAARALMTAAYCRDETESINELLGQAALPPAERDLVLARATELVARVRAKADQQSAVESFMREYDLSSEEGVLLMCVAEALLRIPDKHTTDKLISDKLGEANWEAHLGQSDSVLVNAGTWGLMLTGKLVTLADETQRNFVGAFKRLVGRAGEPVIRLAVRQAMRIMGHQFVMGRTIAEALERAARRKTDAYRYSYDMLGEAALTQPDADRYQQAYQAMRSPRSAGTGKENAREEDAVLDAPSISIKLSALHPRYEVAKRARVHAELTPKLLELAQLAKAHGIGLTVDAEEADRLELSLDVIAAVHADPSLDGWDGYGLAVQAYQKRAPFVIDWLAEHARKAGRRYCVRLVKGAYWDSEIKRAQEGGLAGYPVFTRKPNTDVSFLACARRLFEHGDAFYPAFATHNAHTIAAIHHIAQRPPVRVPAPARHGRRPVRRGDRREQHERALPRLRAGRQPRGPAAVPGAPPARKRREHLVRQPHRRRGSADPGPGRRPGRYRARLRLDPASPHPAADRHVWRTTEEFHGRQFRQR